MKYKKEVIHNTQTHTHTHTHTHTRMLFSCKKDELLPFVIQRKTNTICFHLHVESKKKTKMNKQKSRNIPIKVEQNDGRQKGKVEETGRIYDERRKKKLWNEYVIGIKGTA